MPNQSPVRAHGSSLEGSAHTPPWHFWIIPAIVSAALLGWSITFATYGDEGFHLVAARLINAGELPYRDFFYQHPPLYAYLCAAWTRVFGESWRAAHVLSSVLAASSVLLVARYVYATVPDPKWRYPAGLVASLLLGLHFHFVVFTTIGQPYAMSLMLGLLSFFALTAGARTERPTRLLMAGLCAGAATSASLLSVPLSIVELAWLVRYSGAAKRRSSGAWFVLGVGVAFIPFLWLVALAPGRAVFDVFEYHARYRGPDRLELTYLVEFAKIVAGPLKSPQALLLGSLAAMGYFFLRDRHEWEDETRAELRLAGWLGAGLCLYLLTPYPTFPQYFVLAVPFLALLAAVGVYALGSRLWPDAHPRWVCAAVLVLFSAGLARATLTNRGLLSSNWSEAEQLASMADAVTAPGAPVYFKDDRLYYAAGRLPPPGFGNQFGLDLPADAAARAGVPSKATVEQQLTGGYFATVLVPCDDERVASLDLARAFAESRTLLDGSHCLYWQPLVQGTLARR